MTSINDSLSPDLLFNIFKRLDSVQMTRIRRVCKQWLEIIDEHKSFWRVLHLPKDSLKKWDQSILELFDQKSGSNLQHVEVGTDVKEPFVTGFLHILRKSKESLKYIHFTSEHFYFNYGDYRNKLELLSVFTKVECLKILRPRRTYKVRLRSKSNKSDCQEDGPNSASPLKVLWYGFGRSILEMDIARFSNLVSLDFGSALSSSEWRQVLEGPSRKLKHLRISFRFEDHSGISSLYLPGLEVIELNDGGRIPQWLLIPDTAKLIIHPDVSNLPSISELWTWNAHFQRKDIVNRLPKLETLCLGYVHVLENVVGILIERKANVEAGLQVDGVKMKMIKTLILSFDLSDSDLSDELKEGLERCSELVEVVEGNAQSRFIEVEY